MIQCPECSKDIAEDAAHCGHCGAKVPAAGAGMKTMFGFGAISPEMMKQAADEVAAAKGAAEAASVAPVEISDPFDSQKTIPTPALNLPQPAGAAGLGESSSVFDLNAPGASKPIDAFSPKLGGIESSSPTVEPDSLGAPPVGSADPVWAEPTPPGAAAPASGAPASAMPQSAPQNMGLSEPSAPKFDQSGTGGPQKKSKLPFILAGGCLLFVVFAFVVFILATFLIPML